MERSADGRSVRVIQTYNGKERLEGSIPISETSPEKAFRLEGPA